MSDLERAAALVRGWLGAATLDEDIASLVAAFAAVRADERAGVYAEITRSVRTPRQPGRLDFEEQLSWS